MICRVYVRISCENAEGLLNTILLNLVGRLFDTPWEIYSNDDHKWYDCWYIGLYVLWPDLIFCAFGYD